MPHDWVNVHVFDGDDEHDRTIVKQCARCRMLAIVGETAAASAVDYYPQHIRAPQDCTRGDMTEERASEIAALTEQRDLWARQCNLTSEREADLRNRVAELEAERDRDFERGYDQGVCEALSTMSAEDAAYCRKRFPNWDKAWKEAVGRGRYLAATPKETVMVDCYSEVTPNYEGATERLVALLADRGIVAHPGLLTLEDGRPVLREWHFESAVTDWEAVGDLAFEAFGLRPATPKEASMGDPKLVEAVLGEEWKTLDNGILGTTVFAGPYSVLAAHPTGDAAGDERARQAALGHRALKWLVAYVDGDMYPDAAASIIAELRGGK